MIGRMLDDLSFSPLFRLHNEMNRALEGFFEDIPAVRPYARTYPALNAWEDQEALYVEAELPGLTMEDIEVLVSGNELTVRGTRKLEEPGDASWHRRERSWGEFSRSISLPYAYDAEKVEARLVDGVLTIKCPKAESAKPKKVKVLPA